MYVYFITFVCGQDGARASRSKAGKQTVGHLKHDFPCERLVVALSRENCGSGIVSFFRDFKKVIMDGTKTETRRCWSRHTAGKARFLEDKLSAWKTNLFLRAWCGQNNHIGWILLTNMVEEPLNTLTTHSVAREGYPGESVEWFLNKHFELLPLKTVVWVVSFVFMPCATPH